MGQMRSLSLATQDQATKSLHHLQNCYYEGGNHVYFPHKGTNMHGKPKNIQYSCKSKNDWLLRTFR